MKHIRVACIGAGYWGRNLVRNFHALGNLCCICESDLTRQADLAPEYPGVALTDEPESVLADPAVDAVVIATPAATHGALVRRALMAGKDVFVEKPLCLSADEGERLVRLAEEQRRVIMVGHLLWYHPAVLALKALIDRGELGPLRYLYAHRANLGKIRQEENILWSFAPHDVSVLLGLVGQEPEAVRLQSGAYLQDGVSDTALGLLSFPGNTKGHLFVSWLHPFKEQRLVVVGEKAMAVFDDVARTDKLLLFPHTIDYVSGTPVARPAEAIPVPYEPGEPLRAECQHFLECVRTRSTPRTDGREAVRVLCVLEALEQSAGSVSSGAQIHPTCHIDEGAVVGEGTRVWHFSHILPGTRIGRNCRLGQNVVVGPNVRIGDGVKIQNNVSVYEGVTLEDDVFCGPSMVFTNVYNPRSEISRMDQIRPTLVKRGATLGANATILCGVTVGRYALVGAGAVVLRDVPDHALVVGNPGRVIGWMCTCANRIRLQGETGVCEACGRRYQKHGEMIAPND